MGRDDAVRVGGRRRVLRCPARQPVEAAVDAACCPRSTGSRPGPCPMRVDAVLAVAALGDVGRGEAPVAVLGLLQAVVDLGGHGQRVVDRPAPRAPLLLGDEQGGHQRLEHLAAPARARPGSPRTGRRPRTRRRRGRSRVTPSGFVSCQLQSQVSGNVRHWPKYACCRDLALGDADVGRDPALAHDRVVAARRGAGVRRVVEQDPVDVGPVVEAEVHAVVERPGVRRRPPGRCWRRRAGPRPASRCRPTTGSGVSGSPDDGQTVSFAPVWWSYQL